MKLIKQVIKERHTTQKAIADSVGLTQGTISDYCIGKFKPSRKNAYLIALALRYEGNPEDLFKEV